MNNMMEKVKKTARTIGKGTAMVLKAFGEGIASGAETYNRIEHPETGLNLPTEVTLGAEELKQLKHMYPGQLEKIFRGKTVKLKEDAETYKVLGGFYPGQLEAIFGKEDE